MLREVGDGEFMFNGYRASVWDNDKNLQMTVVMAVQQECTSCEGTLNSTLKIGEKDKFYVMCISPH